MLSRTSIKQGDVCSTARYRRLHCFEHKENGDIFGFAVVKDNSLRLICVSEKYRRQGIGSELLAQAEEHIGKEHNEVILGGASGLFIGAPVSKGNFDKRSFPFFEKRGYVFDDGCAEMELLLDDFSASEYDLPVAENVTFGYIDGTSEALKKPWRRLFPTGCSISAAQRCSAASAAER